LIDQKHSFNCRHALLASKTSNIW